MRYSATYPHQIKRYRSVQIRNACSMWHCALRRWRCGRVLAAEGAGAAGGGGCWPAVLNLLSPSSFSMADDVLDIIQTPRDPSHQSPIHTCVVQQHTRSINSPKDQHTPQRNSSQFSGLISLRWPMAKHAHPPACTTLYAILAHPSRHAQHLSTCTSLHMHVSACVSQHAHRSVCMSLSCITRHGTRHRPKAPPARAHASSSPPSASIH